MTTPIIISHMGYNQNMPKVVIYAPSTHGGLRLKHLHTEQGLQKALQVIKHLQTCTTLGDLIQVAIKAYQIQAGIPNQVLEDTIVLPWLLNRWITNLRNFLCSIHGTIILEDPWTIPMLWTHNWYLLLDFLHTNLPLKDIQILNNCRMYLQVTTLAEITNHNSTWLLETRLQQGRTTPTLQMVSKSLLNWPHQPDPSKQAWLLWTRTIQTIYAKPSTSTKLKHPLGQWQKHYQATSKWYAMYNPTQSTIITKYPSKPAQFFTQPTPLIPINITDKGNPLTT